MLFAPQTFLHGSTNQTLPVVTLGNLQTPNFYTVVHEQMNEKPNKWTNEWMNEQMKNQSTNKPTSEWVSDWMDGCVLMD